MDMIGNALLMERAAELYCKIFQEEPWKEKFRPSQALKIMQEQFKRPKAMALAALEGNEVVGFAWMYQLLETDLKEGSRFSPRLKFLFEGQKNVFYFQEVGIKKELRRQGIGEKLTRELLRREKEKGADVVVLSTNPKAKPIISMFSKIGFQNTGIVRPPKELGRTYWVLELRK